MDSGAADSDKSGFFPSSNCLFIQMIIVFSHYVMEVCYIESVYEKNTIIIVMTNVEEGV